MITTNTVSRAGVVALIVLAAIVFASSTQAVPLATGAVLLFLGGVLVARWFP